MEISLSPGAKWEGRRKNPTAAAAVNSGFVSSGVCLVHSNGDCRGLRKGVTVGARSTRVTHSRFVTHNVQAPSHRSMGSGDASESKLRKRRGLLF